MVWIDIALGFNKEVLSRHLRLHLTVLLVKNDYRTQARSRESSLAMQLIWGIKG